MCGGSAENFFESTADVLLEGTTGGLLGMENGRVGEGEVTKIGVDILKEVTGVKAAEEANKMAREQFEEEKARLAKERKDAKAASAAEQLRQSRQAGSMRGTTSSGRPTGLKYGMMDEERDFLGL